MHGQKFPQIFAKHIAAQPISNFISFTTSAWLKYHLKY